MRTSIGRPISDEGTLFNALPITAVTAPADRNPREREGPECESARRLAVEAVIRR